MPQKFLRKYGEAATIDFSLYEADGVDLRVDAVHATGDTTVMKDEGTEANTTNGFTDEGKGYSLVLSLTEMQAARVVVYVVDLTATKIWLDEVLVIETYGHASAQHAMDFDDAVRGGMSALPNAAADAAGGLPISDAGALDLDAKLANTNEITVARMGALTDWINGGRLDLILDIIAGDVVNLDGAAMRGTDGANTTTPPTVAAIRAEIDSNSTQLAALLVDTNITIPALIAALNDLSTTDVLAQVNAALDTAITELAQGKPTATPTIRTGIILLYMMARNKVDVTSGFKEVHNDAGTVVAKKALSDDATTYSEAEMETGP